MMFIKNPNTRGGGGCAAIVWALASNPWLTTFDLVECLGMTKHAVESAVRACIDRGLVAVDLQPRDIGQGGKRRLRCYALTSCRFVSDARRECKHLTRDQICEVLAESPWMTIQELASEIGISDRSVLSTVGRLLKDGLIVLERDQRAIRDKHGRIALHWVKIYALKGAV